MVDRPLKDAVLALDLRPAAEVEQAFADSAPPVEALGLTPAERTRLLAHLSSQRSALVAEFEDMAFAEWARRCGLSAERVAQAQERAAHGTARIWEFLLDDGSLELDQTPVLGVGSYTCPCDLVQLDVASCLVGFGTRCVACGYEGSTTSVEVCEPTVVASPPARLIDETLAGTAVTPITNTELTLLPVDPELVAARERFTDACLALWALEHGLKSERLAEAQATAEPGARLSDLLLEHELVPLGALMGAIGDGETLVPCSACSATYPLGAALVPHAETVPCEACGQLLDPEFLARLGDQTVAPESSRPVALQLAGDDTAVMRSIGPYALRERLGRGGMSEVYTAEDPDGRLVALKLLPAQSFDPGMERRFEREAQVLTKLEHPNIVQTYGHGKDEQTGRAYIALELVNGADLDRVTSLHPRSRLSEYEAVYVLQNLAQALATAHALGIIHRDVKPSNVLIDYDGNVKLTDFGIALEEDVSVRLTELGRVVGTPLYMAPEVGQERLWTPRADVYSLGVLAFKVLAGEHLFDGESVAEVMQAHVNLEPRVLSQFGISAELSDLVNSMLAKTPDERPMARTLHEAFTELRESYAEHAGKVPANLLPTGTLVAPSRLREPRAMSGTLRAGQTFHHYRVDRELGRGGMGIVYKAFHTGLRKSVALKVMLRGALAGDQARRRFFREAESAGALDHQYVVSVLDVGEERGLAYLAMDYVEGAPLTAYLRQPGVDSDTLSLFVKICTGVHHAHTRGVIHRDLKPDNVLVDSGGDPKILDFGIAKRIDEDDDLTASLTSEGDIVGTLRYMPPEQAAGRIQDIDVRSDVYALGVILYALLTEGQTPFRGNAAQVLKQVLSVDPAAPSTHRAEIPWELDAICLKALSKRRDERYQSAFAFREDVERYLLGRPILAKRAGLIYRARKWTRRNRGKVAVGVLSLVAAAALGGWWQQERSRVERERVAGILNRAHEGWLAASDLKLDAALEAWGGVGGDLLPTDRLLLGAPTAYLLPDALRPDDDTRPHLNRDVLRDWLSWAGSVRRVERALEFVGRAELALPLGRDEEAFELLRSAQREAPEASEVAQGAQRSGAVFLAKARALIDAESQVDSQDLAQRTATLSLADAQLGRARRLLPDSEGVVESETLLGAARARLAADTENLEALRRAERNFSLALEQLARIEPQLDALTPALRAELGDALTEVRVKLEVARSLRAELVGLADAEARVWIGQARIALDGERLELAGDRLQQARLVGERLDEVSRWEARLAALQGTAANLEALVAQADSDFRAGDFGAAARSYDAALALESTPALEARRDLCQALAEADAEARSPQPNLARQRDALRVAQGLHDSPQTLAPEIERLTQRLYALRLGEADEALQAAVARAGGWEEPLRKYELALDEVPSGAAARSGRAEAYAELNRPAGFSLVSVPLHMLDGTGRVDTFARKRIYVGTREVTNAEFARWVQGGGYANDADWSPAGLAARPRLLDLSGKPGPRGWTDQAPPPGSGSFPVTGVSFYEAEAYAKAQAARLPRSDEWTLAACFAIAPEGRALRFPGGDATPMLPRQLTPAGQNQDDRSPWGALDMAFNVSEWSVDPHTERPVVRGLSVRSLPADLERGVRDWIKLPLPTFRDSALGFRLARDVGKLPPYGGK